MKTQSAKAKGRNLQKTVRDWIKQFFNLPDADVQSRSMGASGTDIMLSHRAATVLPFAIECKCQESVSIWAAFDQARTNVSAELPYPLLVIKRNGETPLAVLDAELFFKLVSEAVKLD